MLDFKYIIKKNIIRIIIIINQYIFIHLSNIAAFNHIAVAFVL